MRKNILVGVGILLILLIASVWGYLMMFGTPNTTSDIFTNFGIGDNAQDFPQNQNTDSGAVNANNDTLDEITFVKLSDRPAAGFTFIENEVRFVEEGTGHIYDVTLDGKNEVQVSITTIPQLSEAVFSAAGNRMVLSSSAAGEAPLFGTLTKNDTGENVVEGTRLPQNASGISFTDSNDGVRFYLRETNGSTGYRYNILDDTQSALFSVPLRDIRVLWGTDKTYVLTTPSATQSGGLYDVTNGGMEYVVRGMFGLTAGLLGDALLISQSENSGLSSMIWEGTQSTALALGFLPEKCTDDPAATSTVYCAAPFTYQNAKYPDDWYKGVIGLSDSIWEVNIASGEATLITHPESEFGVPLDVSGITANEDGTKIILQNKDDNTLWLLDITSRF